MNVIVPTVQNHIFFRFQLYPLYYFFWKKSKDLEKIFLNFGGYFMKLLLQIYFFQIEESLAFLLE